MSEVSNYPVQIVRTEGRETVLRGEIFDGESFEFKVMNYLVKPDPDDPQKGWILVEISGRNHNRCSIVLPGPSLKFGDRISVDALKLRRAV